MLGISHPTLAKRMAEAHATPRCRASVPVEIGASSLTPSLTCLGSPRRASDILSSPQEAPAELFSCRPHRAPIVYSTLRYFPPPKSRIKHPRACGSSARRSLADASVSHCRTVVRPLQRMRLERDADDNRTALITPSNARFTDLGMFVSRLTFIQQWSYDRRCRTSHSCQIQTKQLQQTEQT